MRVIRNNNATLNGQYNNNNLILYYTYIKYYNKIRPLPRGRCVLRPLNHTIAAVEMVIKRAKVLIPIFICIKYMYIVRNTHSTLDLNGSSRDTWMRHNWPAVPIERTYIPRRRRIVCRSLNYTQYIYTLYSSLYIII